MVAIIEKRDFRDFDWLTSFLAIAIASFGIWQIHNALPSESYWKKQIIGLGIAVVAFLIVAFMDYRRIIDFAPFFYGFGLILLFLVLTPLGVEVNGQQAWLKLPVIGQFQPSEFVKIPTVLMLAKYFGGRRTGELTFREILIGGAILAGPVGLIMLEPDAGQAITYFPILAAMLFLSAIRIRYVVIVLVATAVLIPAAYMIGVKTGKIKRYQQERINAIIDPDSVDPRGYGYHTIQSVITVGKGGLSGIKGDSETSQSVLKFLPEPHTDFIFHGGEHRLYRLRLAAACLRLADLAAHNRRSRGKRPCRYAGHNVGRDRDVVSDLYQRRNGTRLPSGHWRTVAADERRTLGHPDDVHRHRICGEHQNAPICKLEAVSSFRFQVSDHSI